MFVGKEHTGETWTDVLGWSQDNVKIDDEGFGTFNCPGVSMSIVGFVTFMLHPRRAVLKRYMSF